MGAIIIRLAYFALILILKVVCMADALDEADKIYRSVHEGFTLQDQEFLMDLFSQDDHDHNDDTKPQTNDSLIKDSLNTNDNQLTQLGSEFHKIGMQCFYLSEDSINFEDHTILPSSPPSRYKRPYSDFDAADESQDLFNIMRIESVVDPKRDMEPPPMKKQRSPNENENIGLGRDLERIQFSANYLKQHHAIKQHVSLDESKKIRTVKSKKFDKDKKIIREYFRKQLQHNHIFLKRIPWTTLKREDFIDWPEKLPIKSLKNYNRTELTILLSNMEKIRFSEEFIGRNKALSNENENIGLGRDLERIQFSANYLKQHHAIKQNLSLDESKKIHRVRSKKIDKDKKIIGEYFIKQLQHNHIFLKIFPLTTLKREDFIDWPEKLPIKSLRYYNRTELTILLSNMEKIRFSEEFIGRNKAFRNDSSAIGKGPDQKLKSSKSSLQHTNIIHRRIPKYFQNQLKESQLEKTRINWTKLTPGDFVNWPKNVEIKPSYEYNEEELMILLPHLETIRFSEGYFENSTGKLKKNRKLVRNYLRNLLNEKKIKNKIKWSKLKKEDFINWPDSLPIKSLNGYSSKDLTIILSQLDKIRFSKEFLSEIKEKYKKKYLRPRDSHPYRKLVLDHFRNLLRLNHLQKERINWLQLKKEDFIGWPENLPIRRPQMYNAQEMKILLQHMNNIHFSDEFLKRNLV